MTKEEAESTIKQFEDRLNSDFIQRDMRIFKDVKWVLKSFVVELVGDEYEPFAVLVSELGDTEKKSLVDFAKQLKWIK